jgi:MoaA/NifB/PqqE/SkfB family radical SAM enzyme
MWGKRNKSMRPSKYWDDFNRRAKETAECLRTGQEIPVRRVSVFITERCNMSCSYCNHPKSQAELSESAFDSIVTRYGSQAIIHITGGEPSLVPWLYPYLKEHGADNRFHLNTNMFILPPAKHVKRLKVSLDSCNAEYWNRLVGKNSFQTVVENIKKCLPDTVLSITYTMTRENYLQIPEFINFANSEFPGLYAIFFSVYKGFNKRFVFSDEDVSIFFNNIKPIMDATLNPESKALLGETITEKFRMLQGVRFPENSTKPCYLSLSERVFTPDGKMSGCSHLVRDGVANQPGVKHEKCKYGCNRRLVAFNECVEKEIA